MISIRKLHNGRLGRLATAVLILAILLATRLEARQTSCFSCRPPLYDPSPGWWGILDACFVEGDFANSPNTMIYMQNGIDLYMGQWLDVNAGITLQFRVAADCSDAHIKIYAGPATMTAIAEASPSSGILVNPNQLTGTYNTDQDRWQYVGAHEMLHVMGVSGNVGVDCIFQSIMAPYVTSLPQNFPTEPLCSDLLALSAIFVPDSQGESFDVQTGNCDCPDSQCFHVWRIITHYMVDDDNQYWYIGTSVVDEGETCAPPI